MKDFALAHPWMTCWLLVIVLCGIGSVVQRILRTVNIVSAGWPPEHCDADGDFWDGGDAE